MIPRLLLVLLVGVVGCQPTLPPLLPDNAPPEVKRIDALCRQQRSYQSCLNGANLAIIETRNLIFRTIEQLGQQEAK